MLSVDRLKSDLAIRVKTLTSLLTHSYTADMSIAPRKTMFALVGTCAAFLMVGAGCGGKVIQYPEDHARYLRIDQAVESLRSAYVNKEPAGIKALLAPKESLGHIVQESESDFEAFQEIAMEFTIERIMIEEEDIDVYVHWQGSWKKDPADPGLRQRGHSRLQWVGTNEILLRAIQGDVPFGVKARQALATDSDPQSDKK